MAVAASTGADARRAAEALDELRRTIRGDVLLPEDPDYAEVRPAFNAMYPERSALEPIPVGRHQPSDDEASLVIRRGR
jgi:hypothetical protein